MFFRHPSFRRRQFEQLEARLALDGTASAAAALPWFDPGALTYSFAPDGTRFAGETSRLFAELEGVAPVATWKAEFAKAFEAWLTALDTATHEVPDSGDPFGTLGATQGDPRFGDVRIGAIPLAGNAMAEAIPHTIATQGTWAGDIVLNANADWTDLQQVFSVALHEFGHVLGLGHSDDTASPMYFHGVYETAGPTVADLALLSEFYRGVTLDSSGPDAEQAAGEEDWQEQPHFEFDPLLAEPLTASIASTARYTTAGRLTETQPYVLYQLVPIGAIDHAEYLNLVVRSEDSQGLVSELVLYDMAGDPLPSRTLHNAEGLLVLQARDVEPNQSYFVAVTAAATAAQHQVGRFELMAEYGSTELAPTAVASLALTTDRPIGEQVFDVPSSRLVHLLMQGGSASNKSAVHAIWGTLVDEAGQVITRLAMNHGDARSAPLVFLNPGKYKFIVQTGTADQSAPKPADVEVFIDEVSIDVGPGVVDPSVEPDLYCQLLGADAFVCKTAEPIVPLDNPVYPDPTTLPPTPTYPSEPPWPSPSWLYWPDPIETILHNNLLPQDVSGDSIVSPIDALVVINALNRGQLIGSEYYLDVNLDGKVTPIDALQVINYLNRKSGTGGEGESVSTDQIAAAAVSALAQHDALRRREVDAGYVDRVFADFPF